MLSLVAAMALCVGPEAPIRLEPGRHEVIRVPGLMKVALGNQAVADVTVTGHNSELLLVGRQLGRTSLMLWTPQGIQQRTIVVDDGKTGEVARMVHELVSPGLRVETYNGYTVIDGTLDSVDEANRLRKLVGGDASVKILAHLNPRVLPIVAEQMTAAFQKQGLKDARAVCVGQQLFLEGSVADERELKKAMMIATAYYGQSLSPMP